VQGLRIQSARIGGDNKKMIKIKTLTLTDMRSTLLVVTVLLAALMLTACEQRKADKIAFDGVYFRSTANKLDKKRYRFEVSVAPASSSIAGAREAGRYEATRFCIENQGTSRVDWQDGPDAPDEALIINNDRLVMRGTCAP